MARVKIAELTLDARNANRGTERGRALLEDSLRQYGAGRSILVDKNGVVIAGNKSLQVAAEIGLEEVEVVQTDGTRIVAVQRMDLDLARDESARKLAFVDNRVGEVDLEWDPDVLLAEVEGGLDLSDMWFKDELEELLGAVEGREFDESIADGLELKARFTLICPQEAAPKIQQAIEDIQKEYPELTWKLDETV